MVVAVHHVHLIPTINKKARRKLKIAEAASPLAEVIEQLSFPIEDLHAVIDALYNVDVAFRIDPNSLRSEQITAFGSQFPDRILKVSAFIQHLYAEIQCIHHQQIVAVQPELRGEVELAI